MTGIEQTYVCVEEDELARLKYNDMKLHVNNFTINEKSKSIHADVEQELRYKLEKIERRQLEYQQFVYDLNGDLRSMEIENQQRIQDAHKKMGLIRIEYFNLLNLERNEYLKLFQQQDEKFSALMREVNFSRPESLNNLHTKMDALFEEKNKKKERVKTFTIELGKLLEEINKLPHQSFAPGKLDQLSRQINDAIQDAHSGFSEAALGIARTAYWQLVDLRTLVLEKEQEYLMLYSVLIQALNYLIEKIKNNLKRTLEFGKGNNKKEIELDIDYWTRGQLKRYLKDLEGYLSHSQSTFIADQLRTIIKQIEPGDAKIDRIIERAKENILSSQIRFNIAQKAVSTLKEQLFTVDSSTYEYNDPRSAYFVKLKNRADSEIIIIIKPVTGEFGKNEVLIQSYDNKLINSNALHDRAVELVNSLSNQGLEVGNLQTLNLDKMETNERLKIAKAAFLEKGKS